MTKGVYDHGLTTFGVVAQGQQFYQKSFLLFKNSFFSLFTALSIFIVITLN